MPEERPIDDADLRGGCPIDARECPAVTTARSGSRVVFCEQDNVDGWLASSVVVDLAEMR
jgi:hypothetical protein